MLGGNESRAGHLLQVDVVQVMGAAHSLHHPALWCDHVKGEEWRLWQIHEAGNRPWRHCIIGQEGNIRLQDKAVETVRKDRETVYI